MGIESKIQNSHLVTDIWGKWGSFHDAEVLDIMLNRGDRNDFCPILETAIHVFTVTPKIDAAGNYVLKNNVLVRLRFSNVRNLSLENFNYQNVLQYLEIEHLSDPDDKGKFMVTFEGIFGVTAKFQCDSVSVESAEPYPGDQP